MIADDSDSDNQKRSARSADNLSISFEKSAESREEIAPTIIPNNNLEKDAP